MDRKGDFPMPFDDGSTLKAAKANGGWKMLSRCSKRGIWVGGWDEEACLWLFLFNHLQSSVPKGNFLGCAEVSSGYPNDTPPTSPVR
jgi:hypothetical protein